MVVVGSNGQWESEGHDRPDLSLPGRQRELVEAVLEVNRRTVVVVNAGSPVDMPWASRAGAVLMTWYPGEEGADALADMLVGLAEPSGRLPVTFPARVEDGPAGLGVEGERYPGVEGKVVYGEGVLVGYRFYETTHLAPLFPFGFGLSYGDMAFEDCAGRRGRGRRVTVVNNGTRRGTEVVQVYVRAPESLVRRPDRELVGFAKVGARPRRAADRPGPAGRRRLPLLGRRHPRVAIGPRSLRGARRHLVPRHPGEHVRHMGRPAGVVTGGDVKPDGPRPWTWTWDRLLVEPRRPEAIRERTDAHWFAVAAVCVGAFMGQLDASIVTVALPTLQHTFGVSVGAVTWVGLSYLLVLVATVVAVGRFADMWGRKLLYVYGFVIFTLASVLCGLAPNLGALCGFRALQAVGAAMLQANSLAIIVLVVPARALGRAIGLQGTAQALGLALGPSIGGPAPGRRRLAPHLLRQRPVRAVRRPRGDPAGPPQPEPHGAGALRLDRPRDVLPRRGGARLRDLLRGGAGLELEPDRRSLHCAAVLGGLFVWHERRDSDPMLDLGLFRNARFSTGIASGVGSYLVMFGVLLLIPFYLERGLGLGSARSGLELMAMPLAFGIVAPLAGRLADHVGARPLTVGGMALVALGLASSGPSGRRPPGCFSCWP